MIGCEGAGMVVVEQLVCDVWLLLLLLWVWICTKMTKWRFVGLCGERFGCYCCGSVEALIWIIIVVIIICMETCS